MHTNGRALHAHSYAVSVDTFYKHIGLRKNMKILLTGDHENGKTFINAMEAYNYPIFASMFHPEYQLLDYTGSKGWYTPDNKDTDEIAFRMSLLVNRYARKN